jgi:hypothetical protein
MMIVLSNKEDKFVWKLSTFGLFSVMYADMMDVHIIFLWKYIWKSKVPSNIKIRMILRNQPTTFFSLVPLIISYGE